MEEFSLEAALESLIFVSNKPLSVNQLFKTLEDVLASLEQDKNQENEASESIPLEDSDTERVEAIVDEEIFADTMESVEGEELIEELSSNVKSSEKIEEVQEVGAQLDQAGDELSKVFSKTDIREALQKIQVRYNENPDSGLNLVEVAGGYQFRTKASLQTIVASLYKPSPSKLSRPALETLSIVAYRQPLTRVDVDGIRGVDSGGVLKTLLEKDFIKIVGRKDDVGKPVLYGTTSKFLEIFGLKNLKELPALRDIEEIEKEFRQQAAESGTVLQSEQEEEVLDEGFEFRLNELEEEEKEDILDLESKLKDLRDLEKEIFPPELKSKDPELVEAVQEPTADSLTNSN